MVSHGFHFVLSLCKYDLIRKNVKNVHCLSNETKAPSTGWKEALFYSPKELDCIQ